MYNILYFVNIALKKIFFKFIHRRREQPEHLSPQACHLLCFHAIP